MKLKLSTKFMRGIVSKVIERFIYKKFGCKVDVHLNELDIQMLDGDTNISVSIDAKIKNEDFMNIMKKIDMD